MSKYSRIELSKVAHDEFPKRGKFCPKCKTYIPEFEDLTEDLESRVRSVIRKGGMNLAMAELQGFTGCNARWAKIWVIHKGRPTPEYPGPPCPYCGESLKTSLAKQCAHCLMDWHDEDNPKKLGST